MLAWYAYRMDVLSNDVGLSFNDAKATVFAKDCVGSGPGKTCQFDEFIKYIGKSSTPWAGKTSVGKNLDPNLVKTAQELATNGYVNVIGASKLFPGQYASETTPQYDEFFGRIATNMLSIYQSTFKGLDKPYSSAVQALDLIQDARRAERAGDVIDSIQKKLRDSGHSDVSAVSLPV